MIRVTSREDAVALARLILSPRKKPVLVVTSDPHPGEYAIDLEELTSEIGDLAECYQIETGELTYVLEEHLPPRTHAFGGAGRSYPADFAIHPDPSRSALRFPGKRATANLIADVLAQAHVAGLFAQAPVRNVRATGEVRGFLVNDTRALIDVVGNGNAVVQRELTYPPTPLSWSLHVGQQVSGVLDLDSNRFLVELSTPSIPELRDRFPHGCVTLALVGEVSAKRGELLLHPNVPLTVQRDALSSNPLDTVDLLLAAGDVVRVRLRHHSEGGIFLTMRDVDDDEVALPPVALTEGGRPWLVEDRALPEAVGDASEELAAIGEADSSAVADPWVSAEPRVDPAPAQAPAPAATPVPSPPPTSTPVAVSEAPQSLRPMPGPGMHHVVVDQPRLAEAPRPAAAPDVAEAVVPGVQFPTPEAKAGPPDDPDPGRASAGGALRNTQLQLAAARARIASLERELAATGADESEVVLLRARTVAAEARLREELIERAKLEKDRTQLREKHRQSSHALRQARKATPEVRLESPAERRDKWLSAEEWVRHEVYLAWVERVAATERNQWRLREFAVGDEFAGSLDGLDAGQLAKALRAAVDAVTGRIRELPQREVHPLRSGAGGDDADVVRADGSKCMRAYIEQNTPSARRLHYWVQASGEIELGRVVLHDDVRP